MNLNPRDLEIAFDEMAKKEPNLKQFKEIVDAIHRNSFV